MFLVIWIYVCSYVVDNLKRKRDVDAHWRPQHQCCPVCLLNFRLEMNMEHLIFDNCQFFSIYAKMEELTEDSLYFFIKSGLLSRLSLEKRLNSYEEVKSETE